MKKKEKKQKIKKERKGGATKCRGTTENKLQVDMGKIVCRK